MFFFSWSLGSFKKYVGSEGAIWRKAISHCLMMYFFDCLKYAKKERKGGKIGKIRKHVLFESPRTNFKFCRWIVKIYFVWFNFRKYLKGRNVLRNLFLRFWPLFAKISSAKKIQNWSIAKISSAKFLPQKLSNDAIWNSMAWAYRYFLLKNKTHFFLCFK